MAKLLTREEIAGVEDLTVESVHVPEWGGDVLVRGMNGAERDSFLSGALDGKGGVSLHNMTAKLVAATAVDEAGERLFSEADVQMLAGKSAAALSRIFTVASRLSGISKEDVEVLEKNFGVGRSGDSGSG